MSIATNKKQIEVLVNFMEIYPDIATGYSKKSKEEVQEIWKSIGDELNSNCPPVKSVFEWKRVWSDKKKYVKKKVAENMKSKKSTGGGPSKEYKFSDLEDKIICICGMSESVEGHCGTLTFGLPFSSKKRKLQSQDSQEDKENTPALPIQEGISEAELETALESLVYVEATTCNTLNATPCVDNRPKDNTPTVATRGRTSMKNSMEFLEKETHLQEKLCEQIGEAVQIMKSHQVEIQASVKKIYRSIDRIHDQQKLLLKETIRHNSELERLRIYEIEQKIELKKQFLEIEKAKLAKY